MSSGTLEVRRHALLERLLDDGLTAPAPRKQIPRRTAGVAPPLSFSQERFWFLDRLAPGNPFYVESIAVPMPPGSVDPVMLERAINAVVRRHEILRTSFREQSGSPVQVVAPELHVPLKVIELPSAESEAGAYDAGALLLAEATAPFDLSAAPLMRALLILRPDVDIFSLALHHIICDGWSMRVLQREVNAELRAATYGVPAGLPPLSIQYGDFAAWQRSEANALSLKAGLAHRCGQLADLPHLKLPLDFPRPAMLGYRGAHFDVRLPRAVSGGLRALAARENTTLFVAALAAFAVVLGRHSGQDDIVIGSPVAARSRAEIEPLIGLFLNTVVLRIDLSGDPTFRDLLGRVRRSVLAALDHQDVPFEQLVEAVRPVRDLGRNPLFQVLFQLFTPPDEKAGDAGAEVVTIPIERGAAILDLSFHLWDSREGIAGRIEYSSELFVEASIRRLFDHFASLVAAAVAAPSGPISALEIFAPSERAAILSRSRGPRTAPPAYSTLLEAVEARLRREPDAVALLDDGHTVTCAALSGRAEAFATRLSKMGIGRRNRVAICLDRSTGAIAAMIGTLRLGAAFVPLDPSHPGDRIRYIIEDSGAKVVVAHEPVALGAATHCPAGDDADPPFGPEEDTTRTPPAPLDVAYVIYTSGSTGRPKGVMGTHAATVNRFAWMLRRFPFAPGEVACQKTAITFVDSLWETFGPLIAGVPLVIAPEAAVKSPRALIALLGEHGVTRLLLVPSLLRALLDARVDWSRATKLRICFCSGERLTSDLVARLTDAAPDLQLVNLYGSSEVAGDVTFTDPSAIGRAGDADPPIGLPLDNCDAFVLDARMRLVPEGAVGSLYVGGPNLARGYLSQPRMTAERFVPNPFAEASGERLFATGDLVRHLPDGSLAFIGRADHQVKIRGYRVELGEIEAALLAHPSVGEAAALVTDDGGGGRLDAWITPAPGTTAAALDLAAIRRHAAITLPSFMMPSKLTPLDALPRNPNGKMDRLALAAIAASDDRAAGPFFVPCETKVEEELAAMWSALLGREKIGATENFFEIGGHSLLATRLAAQIDDRFQIDLPLTAIFLKPTVSELAGELESILAAEIAGLSDEEVRHMLDRVSDVSGETVHE